MFTCSGVHDGPAGRSATTQGVTSPAGYTVEVVNPRTEVSYYPKMGVHYLNPDLLDENFDIEHPELLVYLPQDDGQMELVAVETWVWKSNEAGIFASENPAVP